ncbi:hypothetical protein CPBF426_09020 [Xanthomonas arboricola pv. juglandis]|nr:hypothetical protein [Xanthomonas euroxanthea]MBB5769056.1 hypothetical protein [Xanthomonas euroxanthea]NJC39021.1 hypothetical protein [Xanthomonas euroxanthea]SYZ51289.1 hypothetical protein CPBF426_09020 [Xanthomonas arboricola pv. juglandis]
MAAPVADAAAAVRANSRAPATGLPSPVRIGAMRAGID